MLIQLLPQPIMYFFEQFTVQAILGVHAHIILSQYVTCIAKNMMIVILSTLQSADVMDYSLLVGIDEEKKELVIGIIDYLRQYTWDKQLETWVKASGILGGPKNEAPTIISPLQYKKRFRKAMSKYFLTVPDQWTS